MPTKRIVLDNLLRDVIKGNNINLTDEQIGKEIEQVHLIYKSEVEFLTDSDSVEEDELTM